MDAAGVIVAAGNFHGKAVQVDPMKPMLKPPGTEHSCAHRQHVQILSEIWILSLNL